MTTQEIRRRFLEFFQQNGHEAVRSSSLIPKDDPSLLFTNAGMVQFKTLFQGLEKRNYTRATTSQKCLRVGGKHNDLENVGRTARHHTFFEMLGNFSFGDYFKREAITLAWRFITEELKLPKEKLYVTVFRDDDEAAALWQEIAQFPAERVIRMGEKDNFWSMGDTGPCGPCSEIYIDQGEQLGCGPQCGIGICDCDRFLEIWNLVFMQFNQLPNGTREALPRPSIDTGMGLERITAVCQGVYSNFDIDLFKDIIGHACALAGVTYSRSAPDTNDVDTALRVIADHSRSVAFMVADGIMPSNEGRGYVLRRLIRRAYRFGRLIGMPKTFLHSTADKVVELMGPTYPELLHSHEFMQRVVLEEEERFAGTLDNGLALLEEAMADLTAKGSATIPGELAFRLYDTFGFPLDIVNDVCEKRGFTVDEAGFTQHMKEQKTRAKAAWKGSGEADLTSRFTALLEEGLRCAFVGYDALTTNSRVVALLSQEGDAVEALAEGQSGWLVAGQTPFYGASGGQAGDVGTITSSLGTAKVTDTMRPSPDLVVQHVTITHGQMLLDAEVALAVDAAARVACERNHTCTHLLHAALQNVLGSHARQAGSLVTPERLRFDFNHISGVTDEEIAQVEAQVNAAILADLPLCAVQQSYDDAVAAGATALFGEKYGDTVRVVTVEGTSTELCGGTHLRRTGQAGLFVILSEAGVAAGVRRIEAATGENALRYLNGLRQELHDTQKALKCRPGETAKRVEALQADMRDLRKQAEKAAAQAASGQGKNLMDSVEQVNGVALLCAQTQAPNVKALRDLADDVRSKMSSGVFCLTAEEDGKVHVLVGVSKDLHARFTAPALIKDAAALVGGSGGGRPDMAQAGGNNPAGIDAMFAKMKELLGA
ncbi:alanine--tRNA ligase [Desulfovibrio cuneatus]|uniref:alanine--tRNA ligase n=1 Tax=Desulfovibrio cuneatus TaxID=159728 RepID=UPI00040B865C|nr:alanine--tRNA ligase [Desulfovibrio cuneatus]